MTGIIDELTWRGLLAQSTDRDDLRKALDAGPVTVYAGFDPTAPGLHIGSLALLLTLRRLQDAGHRPIGLVGGATGLIGDPSGRTSERTLSPAELVAEWVERIRGEVARFLDFSAGPAAAVIVSNLDWTAQVTAVEFLRDVGKHFSVNQMIARESVKARLEADGISYTEFSYQILQALDFLELYRRHGCTLQIGGSDQWGNLVAGVDLVRRVEHASVHVMTIPLITKPDGTKYGKTSSGTIWLSPELTSPYAFYQFWFNVEDSEVGRLLRVFTFRSREEIEALEREAAERPRARAAQRALAGDVTTLVHGAEECQRVVAASQALFGQGDLRSLDERTLAAALAEVPSVTVTVGGDGQLPPLVDLLAGTGIVPSKSAARRAVDEGGAYLNNRKVTDENARPSGGDLLHGRFLVLRRGKRTVAGVEVIRA
ncbi:MAG TPA: tyrosine--tRNA ligase [Streptosporangiaceae bacterium]|nr:tyrosine--tRNA ligase [Streptosporangiaceae bacterium]